MLADSGRPDVLVGKEDGIIELYAVDENDTLTFRQLVQCEESITGLQGGRIGSAGHPELVVATYTGWVFGLTTEPVFTAEEKATGGGETPTSGAAREAPQMEVKVQQMRSVVIGSLMAINLSLLSELSWNNWKPGCAQNGTVSTRN